MRSFLSAIGIMVGTTAIMLLVSIALGVKEGVTAEVDELGTNLLVVMPGIVNPSEPFSGSGTIGLSPFTNRDVESLKKIQGVKKVVRWALVGGVITSKKGRTGAFAIGCDPEWFSIAKHEFSEGVPFNSVRGNVAVLGSNRRSDLFKTGKAIGEEIRINNFPFEVVGVLKGQNERNLLSGPALSNIVVYIPFEEVSKMMGQEQIHRVFVQTDPAVEPISLKSAIEKSMLRTQNGSENFSVLTQEELLQAVYNVLRIVTYLVVGISTVALAVGGLGVMTVMLMNVNERTREIGIRKTVGARRIDIFTQFFWEAVLLTSLGGLFGLAMTYVGINLLEWLTPIRAILTLETVILGFAVSTGVGCVFGLLPALRAASKDPVESMRYE